MASQIKYPYQGKCIAFITGASRGFGRAISQLICNKEDGILGDADKGSRIVLMSRDASELEKTKILIQNENKSFDIDVVQVDLNDIRQTQDVVEKTLTNCGNDFQSAFLFSNAGLLGDASKTVADLDDIEKMQQVYHVNVISPSYLISRFCKHFVGVNRFVISTSTLAAIQPFSYTSLYSSSKAGMDMYIRNLATDCPDVRALNYAPGPMDTEMGREVRDKTGSKETKEYFTMMFNEGKIVNPVDSVKKMLMLVRKNEFENGSHIDFYEV